MSSPAPAPAPDAKRPFWRRHPIIVCVVAALALGGIIDAFDGPDDAATSSQAAEDIAAARESTNAKNRAAREERAAEREQEQDDAEREREREAARERALAATPSPVAPNPPPKLTVDPPPAANTVSPEQIDADIADAVYIGTLDMGDIVYSTEALAISAGKAVCADLDTGSTFYDVGIAAVIHGGYSPEDAGYIVGAAITAYCPEYAYMVGG